LSGDNQWQPLLLPDLGISERMKINPRNQGGVFTSLTPGNRDIKMGVRLTLKNK